MELLAVSLLFLYFAATPATCWSNETDFSALLAFKNAIDDDPLGALRSWNETVHFCDWEGILCSKRHRGRVEFVNLVSRGLVGSLPPHFGNLSFLREFVLQNNSFYGEIPEEFGRLRRLEFIEFSNNSISGEIPRNLSMCSNLYYLSLIDNHLRGIIIPELSSMFQLKALGLSQNNLSGTIPPFIGNLTNLFIDDMWKMDARESIRYAFPRKSARRRIINAPRLYNISDAACCETNGHLYHLDPLTDEKSAELFYRKSIPGKFLFADNRNKNKHHLVFQNLINSLEFGKVFKKKVLWDLFD